MKKLILMTVTFTAIFACTPHQERASQVEVNKYDVVVENIMNRRSIRKYTDKEVSKEQLQTIMECAINAPSASNLQSWQVRVIQNPGILSKFRAVNEKAVYDASTVIVVAQDTEKMYSSFDCGLLTQNILLAAESMGLGTCVVGSVPHILKDPRAADVLEILDLPENYEVIVGICLGYKDESPDAKPRDPEKVKYIE